jgi:protoporphyrin/coproporphyrin ferrochelatase
MSFDAILMIAFGGPEKPEDIRPFLRHVLAGRPVPPNRIEEVAHHYEAIGGRSPLNELTAQQASALRDQLAARGRDLPIELGMWHAAPFIADTLQRLAATGVRRVLGVVMAAFHDSSTLERYKGAVTAGIAALGLPDFSLQYADSPEALPGFAKANAASVRAAFARVPAELRGEARLVFTAHSVPVSVGEQSGYVARYQAAAQRIASELGTAEYRLAYQSRSGNPRDPWLEPDIGEVVRAEAASGARALVVAPIGFVCDHVEVLYDLDVEAANIAREVGVHLERASAVNSHPEYIGAVAQTVLDCTEQG